ncbi:hypothetical protein DEM27_16195 [Metarhizobium album]|uniref:Uncharacterized protein n=1 Tax=Metarhizobium album TaxID=2182425 RepID=A0A2U2DNV4_9HYPH|nr:hypothetical protein [Rhizobium album]PWE54996.1 hypothetical protein DEM27_16195 [Rhizobium album]
MKPYDSLDTLYEFLKSIESIDEFFERKEPHFNDAASKAIAIAMMEEGTTPEDMLGILKSEERQRFAAEQDMRRKPN